MQRIHVTCTSKQTTWLTTSSSLTAYSRQAYVSQFYLDSFPPLVLELYLLQYSDHPTNGIEVPKET